MRMVKLAASNIRQPKVKALMLSHGALIHPDGRVGWIGRDSKWHQKLFGVLLQGYTTYEDGVGYRQVGFHLRHDADARLTAHLLRTCE